MRSASTCPSFARSADHEYTHDRGLYSLAEPTRRWPARRDATRQRRSVEDGIGPSCHPMASIDLACVKPGPPRDAEPPRSGGRNSGGAAVFGSPAGLQARSCSLVAGRQLSCALFKTGFRRLPSESDGNGAPSNERRIAHLRRSPRWPRRAASPPRIARNMSEVLETTAIRVVSEDTIPTANSGTAARNGGACR